MPNEDESPAEKPKVNSAEKTNETAAEKSDSDKIDLAFSSRPPLASDDVSDSGTEKTKPEAKASTGGKQTWIIGSLAGLIVLSVGAYFIWQHFAPPKAPVKAGTPQVKVELNEVENLDQKYDKLSAQINEELSHGSKSSPKLHTLAKDRFAVAKKMANLEKMTKSADFVAAMADGLGLTEQALYYYDLHNLIAPDQRILEAKFRIYRRFNLTPTNPEEQMLYDSFVKMERAEDQLANEMTVLDEDYYSKLLHLRRARKEQLKQYVSSNKSYNELLKTWYVNRAATHLMSVVLAKQGGATNRELDLSINFIHPESRLIQINKWKEFEDSSAYSKRKWYLVLESPGLLAYMSTDKSTMVLLKLNEEESIVSARIVSLPACSGEKFDDSLFDLLALFVFGAGADEISESTGILKATLVVTEPDGPRYTWNNFIPLFSKENLAGFEVRRAAVDWAQEPSIDEILAQLPKEHEIKKKFGGLTYIDQLQEEPRSKK